MTEQQTQKAGAEGLYDKVLKAHGLKQGTPQHDKLLFIGRAFMKRLEICHGLLGWIMKHPDVPTHVKLSIKASLSR